MTCRELVEFLDDYVAGELAAGERVRFEDHLRECPACVAYLQNYREVVRLGRSLGGGPGGAPPEGMPEELVRAILAARRRDR